MTVAEPFNCDSGHAKDDDSPDRLIGVTVCQESSDNLHVVIMPSINRFSGATLAVVELAVGCGGRG